MMQYFIQLAMVVYLDNNDFQSFSSHGTQKLSTKIKQLTKKIIFC